MVPQTTSPEEEAKDGFHEQVQYVVDKIPKHDMVILMEGNGEGERGGGGLECEGWGINKMVKKKWWAPRTAWGEVRKWGTLRRTVRNQRYDHRKPLCFLLRISTGTLGYRIARRTHQEPDRSCGCLWMV